MATEMKTHFQPRNQRVATDPRPSTPTGVPRKVANTGGLGVTPARGDGRPTPRGMRLLGSCPHLLAHKRPPHVVREVPTDSPELTSQFMVTVASSPASLPVSVQPAQTSAIFTCPMCGRGFRLKRKARTARPLCSGKCRALASRQRRGNTQAHLNCPETGSPHGA